jgi:hypothetical protein
MPWWIIAVLTVAGFGAGWLVGQLVILLKDDGRYDLFWDEDE